MFGDEFKVQVLELARVMHIHGISHIKIGRVISGYFLRPIDQTTINRWLREAGMKPRHKPFGRGRR